MRSDSELHRDVLAELNWDPSIRDEDIAVAVKGGVVTLAGTVDSWPQRSAAVRAAERVKGVRAIANDLTVKLPSGTERSDADIAHAAVNALKWDIAVPDDRIKVKVADGWITLEGDVEWYYQKAAAERAVAHLAGAKGVGNRILLRPPPSVSDIKQRIKDMLKRQAELDADHIMVETADRKITLRGTVRSLTERKDAERAAWNAPGVTSVENQLEVSPPVAVMA